VAQYDAVSCRVVSCPVVLLLWDYEGMNKSFSSSGLDSDADANAYVADPFVMISNLLLSVLRSIFFFIFTL